MDKKHLRFPAALVAARTKKGWAQKQLALEAHMQQSLVSRLENGRRSAPEQATVARLAAALQLDEAATEELMLARSHDEVVVALSRTEFARSAPLVSQALWSSLVMSDLDISALASHIHRLDAGPRALLAYRRTQQEEEAAMS